jgi:hypothetical protein
MAQLGGSHRRSKGEVMKKYIIQHAVSDETSLLDLCKPVNQKYATKFGFEYQSDTKSRCNDRPYYWEKIAYLQEYLPTINDGSLVVWEDADSLNIGDEDISNALPTGTQFGMVQNRGGLNNSLLIPWYNSGVMVFVNTPIFRKFLDRAWARNGRDDEVAIVEELKVSTDVSVTPLDPKWNCWRNNENICSNPVFKTFHGIKLPDKLKSVKSYLDKSK